MAPYYPIWNEDCRPNDTGHPINGDWIAAYQEGNLVGAIGPRLNLYLEETLKPRRGEQMTQCKSCKANIQWCTMKTGKKMPQGQPFKAVQVKEGVGEIIDVHLSHWATCPGADSFRGKKP